MAYTLTAALLTEIGKPLELEELECTALQYGQVFVRVLVSGICGKQLGEISGAHDASMPLPRPLGHEGVGLIEWVGPGVTKVKAGDKVVMHWRKGDGIESDFPRYVRRTPTDYGHVEKFITGGKVTTFMDWAIVSENRLTPVPLDTPNELCALLGCGLSTALGTIESEACVKFGESVLIIGCGGLGLNLILAAKLAHAGHVAAVDVVLTKAEAALTMGADRFDDCVAEDRYDVVIDTTGKENAIADGMKALGPSGRFILVGQPKTFITIPHARRLFDGTGCTIKATQGGRFNPTLDIPRYLAMHAAGLLKLDGIVSHRVKLEEINRGLDLVRNGQAGRVLVEMT